MTGLRIIVCGGRDFTCQRTVDDALDAVRRKRGDFTLVHDGDHGASLLAACWAASRGIEAEAHPINVTDDHGHILRCKAERMRNQYVLELGTDAVVAFSEGTSAEDMCRRAEEAGVPVWRVPVRGQR